MNINSLGPETIEEYYRQGLIKNAADLYTLSEEQLTNPTGTDQKSVKKILKSIQDSKSVPFERVLFAVGIRFVGEIAAKTLARNYGSMKAVSEATLESLMEINGIGQVIAQSVIQYFTDEQNRIFIDRLQQYGLQMQLSETQLEAQSEKLKGQSIVISGVFAHHSRDEYKTLIEQHGGKNVGSISAKTSFILAGENMGPSKLEKAQKLGIRILNEEEFLQLLNNQNA
jgi:DNA ligase (NAD+)